MRRSRRSSAPALAAPRREVFDRVWEVAHAAAGAAEPVRRALPVLPARASVPYLTEPWYC